MEQFRSAAQCVADRIDELIRGGVPTPEATSRAGNAETGRVPDLPAGALRDWPQDSERESAIGVNTDIS